MNSLTCNKCKLNLPQEAFYPSSLARKRPTMRCKQCQIQSGIKWLQNNRDKYRAASRRRYADNPDKYRAKAAQTHARNPQAAKLKRQNRRSTKNCAVPQRWGHHETAENICYWCGERIDGKAHLDHIMPVKLHGSSEPKNLVTTCAPCNIRKADKHPLLWIATLVQ